MPRPSEPRYAVRPTRGEDPAMKLVLVLITLVGYYYGVGRLIEWGCTRANKETPSWWDRIGALLGASMVSRLSMRLVPDAWGWPEPWIAISLWILLMFLVLRAWFKIRFGDSLLIAGAVLVLALLTMLDVVSMLDKTT